MAVISPWYILRLTPLTASTGGFLLRRLGQNVFFCIFFFREVLSLSEKGNRN